jgi:hypothetical protein
MEINRDTVEMQWRYSRDWRLRATYRAVEVG